MPVTEQTTALINTAVEAILTAGNFTEVTAEGIFDGDTVLMVLPDRITLGKVDVNEGEMRTYRFEHYSVAGESVVSRNYAITEQGWAQVPTVTKHVSEQARFYEQQRW